MFSVLLLFELSRNWIFVLSRRLERSGGTHKWQVQFCIIDWNLTCLLLYSTLLIIIFVFYLKILHIFNTKGVFDCRKVNFWNSLSMFSHVWQQYEKIVKGNWIPVKLKKVTLRKESVFLLLKKRKHFPSVHFLMHIFSYTAGELFLQNHTVSFSSKSIGNWAGTRVFFWTN